MQQALMPGGMFAAAGQGQLMKQGAVNPPDFGAVSNGEGRAGMSELFRDKIRFGEIPMVRV